MEVLALVEDADVEVRPKLRFSLGLGYNNPKAAMMADIESDFPDTATWPGGPTNALIRMRHLAGLQAVIDNNAEEQAGKAAAKAT